MTQLTSYSPYETKRILYFCRSMKQLIHKIISVSLTFVVLLSTMSFAVDLHFCGETLMDTAIFQKADTCGMEMENSSKEDCSVSKKSCCSNEKVLVDGQNELQQNLDKISFEQQVFLASFVYSYQLLFEGLHLCELAIRNAAHWLQ